MFFYYIRCFYKTPFIRPNFKKKKINKKRKNKQTVIIYLHLLEYIQDNKQLYSILFLIEYIRHY